MELSISELLIHSSHYEREHVFASWGWRIGPDAEQIVVTTLGHVFFQAADGGLAFLDTWLGDVTRVADDFQEFRALLDGDSGFQDDYLRVDVIGDLLAAGLRLKPGECFSPFVSPGVGGSLNPDNFRALLLKLHLHTSAAERLALLGRTP